MRERLRVALLIVLALSIMAMPARATEPNPCVHGTARVRGMIRDHDGSPAVGAKLHFRGIEWQADCRSGRGIYLDVVTDSTGRYEITAPAGRATLVIENRYRNGTYDRFVLLADSVLIGEIRADYRFERWHVKGQIVGLDGKPMQAGTLTYFIRSEALRYDTVGAPAVPIRDGAFELDVCPRGEYVFWPNAGSGWLMTSIPIPGDTTITLDVRQLAQEKK